jgi:hypothetical protein
MKDCSRLVYLLCGGLIPAVALVAIGCATMSHKSMLPTVRINAGATAAYTNEAGDVWLADQGFTGGEAIARYGGMEIANTSDPDIYRTERYSMTSFAQEVPNGRYVVNLHFAETFEEISSTGQRVFTFNVEGTEFEDFDIVDRAGAVQRAYVEAVPVDITDGQLDIAFSSKVQNAAINGIEILPGR